MVLPTTSANGEKCLKATNKLFNSGASARVRCVELLARGVVGNLGLASRRNQTRVSANIARIDKEVQVVGLEQLAHA